MMRTPLPALLLATLGLATLPVHAAPDKEAGHLKVYTCHGCHGVPGYENAYPNYHVPRITGQNALYLENALKAYKSGEREHPTMRAQGESLSDEDIQDIAAYLSSLDK